MRQINFSQVNWVFILLKHMPWMQTCRECLLRKHHLLRICICSYPYKTSPHPVPQRWWESMLSSWCQRQQSLVSSCKMPLEEQALNASSSVSALFSWEITEKKNLPSKSRHWDLWTYKICSSLHTCTCLTTVCPCDETTWDWLCHWIQNGFTLICSLPVLFCKREEPV